MPKGWAEDGPFRLLSVARKLFVHAQYEADFLPVAVLVAYQAVEAAFRVLYPVPAKAKFASLIQRAVADGHLSGDRAAQVDDLREMRNLLSHPLALPLTPAESAWPNMLGFAHQVVADIMTAAAPERPWDRPPAF